MKQSLLYSPLPPEAYSRPCPDLGRVGVGAELADVECCALWNLYYLSDPAIDSFITGWGDGPLPDLKLLAACGKALEQKSGGLLVGELVSRCTPQDFLQHLLLHPHYHRHLAPYMLRGAAWVRALQTRAQAYRGVVAEHGSVVHVNFARKPSSVTSEANSAKIMTLALRKT